MRATITVKLEDTAKVAGKPQGEPVEYATAVMLDSNGLGPGRFIELFTNIATEQMDELIDQAYNAYRQKVVEVVEAAKAKIETEKAKKESKGK